MCDQRSMRVTKAATRRKPEARVMIGAAGQSAGTVEAKGNRAKPVNTARECGDCRVCCTLFEIAEVNKGLNRPCRHQSGPGEPGCKIYGHRPQVCREFECAWKQGLSGEGDRPDRLGIMLYTVQLEDGGPGLAIVEATPGAFEKPRVREMISIYQNRKPGRIILRRAEDRRFKQASVLIEGKPLSEAATVRVTTPSSTARV